MKIYKYIASIIRKFHSKFESNISLDPFGVNIDDLVLLKNLPPLTHTFTPLLGKKIEITDPYWYVYSYEELFINQIYRFTSTKETPYIIDCGANIGLSILFFKNIFPKAVIIAFEPDAEIFTTLKRNIQNYNLSDVTLIQKAVWTSDGEHFFYSDGSVGGRLLENASEKMRTIQVQTVRLLDYLESSIDFLKIDIEGAEYSVICDIAYNLHKVENLFVEYHGKPNENQNLHHLLDLFSKAGFRYFITQAHPHPFKHPFIREDRQNYTYDLQLNIFCYRNYSSNPKKDLSIEDLIVSKD